jgi:hypothetical protein
MDGERFDAMTRQVATSRRTLLHRLIASAGGAALGGVALLEAAARGKRHQRRNARRRRRGDVQVCLNGEELVVPRSAVRGVLLSGGTLGACPFPDDTRCAAGHVLCQGYCCPPPPQGGKARCCPDGSCGCAGACCRDACFYDDKGGDRPADEFCCSPPEWEICPTKEGKDTCCPEDPFTCSCAEAGGIAGSYRRPGR